MSLSIRCFRSLSQNGDLKHISPLPNHAFTLTISGCCWFAVRVLLKPRNRSLFYFDLAVIEGH